MLVAEVKPDQNHMFREPNNTVAIAFKRNPKGKSKHSHVSCLNRKIEHPPKPDTHYSIILEHAALQLPDTYYFL